MDHPQASQRAVALCRASLFKAAVAQDFSVTLEIQEKSSKLETSSFVETIRVRQERVLRCFRKDRRSDDNFEQLQCGLLRPVAVLKGRYRLNYW